MPSWNNRVLKKNEEHCNKKKQIVKINWSIGKTSCNPIRPPPPPPPPLPPPLPPLLPPLRSWPTFVCDFQTVNDVPVIFIQVRLRLQDRVLVSSLFFSNLCLFSFHIFSCRCTLFAAYRLRWLLYAYDSRRFVQQQQLGCIHSTSTHIDIRSVGTFNVDRCWFVSASIVACGTIAHGIRSDRRWLLEQWESRRCHGHRFVGGWWNVEVTT